MGDMLPQSRSGEIYPEAQRWGRECRVSAGRRIDRGVRLTWKGRLIAEALREGVTGRPPLEGGPWARGKKTRRYGNALWQFCQRRRLLIWTTGTDSEGKRPADRAQKYA